MRPNHQIHVFHINILFSYLHPNQRQSFYHNKRKYKSITKVFAKKRGTEITSGKVLKPSWDGLILQYDLKLK